MVWDAIATTYFNGSDTSQVYELRRHVTRLRQGSGSLEKFYTKLQGLWREIDFRLLNPMECAIDIYHYNNLLQEDHVYTFLDGFDDRLDNTRSDVLQMRPFSSIEQVYAHVRKEALRKAIMSTNDPDNTIGMVLTTKWLKLSSANRNSVADSSHEKSTIASKSRTVPDGMKCSHCGNQRHISENCFKKIGYPDWWYELQAKKKNDSTSADVNKGKVVIMLVEPHLSLIS